MVYQITAKPTYKKQLNSCFFGGKYNHQALASSEVMGSNKRDVKAFCQTQFCFDSRAVYNVINLGKASEKYVDKKETMCPSCGMALFWSRNYIYLGSRRELGSQKIALELAKKEELKGKKWDIMSKNLLNVDQHIELGNQTKHFRSVIIKALGSGINKTSAEAKALLKMEKALDTFKCEMDSVACKEFSEEDLNGYSPMDIYYGEKITIRL